MTQPPDLTFAVRALVALAFVLAVIASARAVSWWLA